MSAVATRSSREPIWTNLRFLAFLRGVAERFTRAKSNDGTNEPVHEPIDEKCIFCLRDDKKSNKILFENDTFFARFDNFPAAKGHLEIVPKRHVESLFALSDQEAAEAYSLLRKAQRHLARRYRPDGYTIGVNEGVAAGQSIPHLHIHLIPRHHGDVADPRGGIRQATPNWDPDNWASDAESS